MTATQHQPPIIAQPEDLHRDLLAEAYYANTMHLAERIQQEQQGYAEHVQSVYATMLELCTSDAQRALLAEEMERYRTGYLAKYSAVLRAMSRTASPMVVGPAKFPHERNQKRLATEHKRRGEHRGWSTRAQRAIRQKILALRTPEELHEEAWQELRRDIAGNLNVIAEIDTTPGHWGDRSAFVNSIARRTRTRAQNGEVELVERALALVEEYNQTHGKPAMTNRHAFWTFAEVARQARAAQAAPRAAAPAATGSEVIAEGNGVRVEKNYDEQRVQIFFDTKPGGEMIARLKGSGWRWSRLHGCWQRQLTANAAYSARHILGITG